METHNLEKLTDRIYQEGIERVNKEAEEIVSIAKAEAEKIIEEAHSKASTILSESKEEADLYRKNIESDLRLKGRQAVNELKNEIRNVISDRLVGAKLKSAMRDEDFLKKLILKIADAWKDDESIELHLPAHLAEDLSDHFSNDLIKELPSLEINFSERLKGGFRIAHKEDGFELSFTDQDFIEFFRPYLNATTSKLIFES